MITQTVNDTDMKSEKYPEYLGKETAVPPVRAKIVHILKLNEIYGDLTLISRFNNHPSELPGDPAIRRSGGPARDPLIAR